jgi:integrase
MVTISTCARASETAGMEWAEINFDKRLWTIPKERMKNGKEAKVPLSAPAIAILREIKEECPSDKYVFVGRKGDETISDATMLRLLQRDMERKDYTVHGFRTSFRTWGQEKTEFSREILEHCLHHIEGSETEKAYKRGDALEKRAVVMNAWADYCLPKPGLKLVA